jgi:hypothetical protein
MKKESSTSSSSSSSSVSSNNSKLNNEKKFPPTFIDKEFERKRAYDIVISMEEKSHNRQICEWGIKGFASIASLAMIQQNAESMADFLDDGGCEALINIMNRYGEESILVAAYGCLTIAILAWSLRELKEFLGEIGGCEVVCYVASLHIGDAEVSEYGSLVIGVLADNNIANSYRLSEASACDVLSQLGNYGFNLRHDRCSVIAKNVCYAFAQLAEAVNAKRLMECGASSLISHLTKLHFKNEDFSVAAVHCLCALASLNPFHREELGKNGICKLLVDILQVHCDNIPLVKEGCETIMHLSLSPSNADKLSDNDAVELILYLFARIMMEIDFGTEICSGCLLHFATYGTNAKKNRIKLIMTSLSPAAFSSSSSSSSLPSNSNGHNNHNSNIFELLKTAQFSSKASFKARENILALQEVLNKEISLHPDLLRSSSGSSSSSSSSSSNAVSSGNNINNPSTGGITSSRSGSFSITPSNSSHLVSVIHGSEMKGNTVPLHVEVREIIEYDSFHSKLKPSTSGGSLSRSESPIVSSATHLFLQRGIDVPNDDDGNDTLASSPLYSLRNNTDMTVRERGGSFFGKLLFNATGRSSRSNSNAPLPSFHQGQQQNSSAMNSNNDRGGFIKPSSSASPTNMPHNKGVFEI